MHNSAGGNYMCLYFLKIKVKWGFEHSQKKKKKEQTNKQKCTVVLENPAKKCKK